MNWTAPEIFIHATDSASAQKAKSLADLTGLPLASEMHNKMHEGMHNNLHKGMPTGWRLLVGNNTLQLVRPDDVSVSIDFINGKATRRAQELDFKKQPLARALGLHKLRINDKAGNAKTASQAPTIIDATAGLGTDAWMMASLGCSVTLLEQSPVLCVLLQNAIDEASLNAVSATTANQLSLIKANSIDYLLNDETVCADVIYLDPMYPAARKQALVKKGMQLLHELIGPDDNGPALLNAALKKAKYRVVVKRPKGAPELGDLKQTQRQSLEQFPGYSTEQWSGQITQVESPNTRFDIYHTANR